ncbi:MAG: ribose-phosphate pyrophosphokinase [Clostridiales bacterium]|jgi:ribose-phosphate pyrophosphokinase|nr:ribose-phosphate pyrophosphokinase [Clostridiales bacterium]
MTFINPRHKVKLFAGNACPALAKNIADKLQQPLGAVEAGKFSDGETSVHIGETVRGQDVFVIQSTSYPVNDNLMELLIIVDALKRASAGRITAVMPYFGYARQDRKAKARDPISAKLVADLITAAGANRVLTMDLHAPQLQGFFNIPVDNLLGMSVLTKYILKSGLIGEDFCVVSPDVGSTARARSVAQRLNCPIAIVDKRRPRANAVEIMNIVGDVKDKVCLIVDDMVDTAGTMVLGAEAIKSAGAREVYACCTHAVLSGPAVERLANSCLKTLFVLDTVEHETPVQLGKLKYISVAPIFAEAIESIYAELPISKLYE